jgi:hypothetical protein
MDRFPDFDIDDNEPARTPRRAQDEPDTPTREEILQEARDFHDSWSRQNPYDVWGGNTFNYCD